MVAMMIWWWVHLSSVLCLTRRPFCFCFQLTGLPCLRRSLAWRQEWRAWTSLARRCITIGKSTAALFSSRLKPFHQPLSRPSLQTQSGYSRSFRSVRCSNYSAVFVFPRILLEGQSRTICRLFKHVRPLLLGLAEKWSLRSRQLSFMNTFQPHNSKHPQSKFHLYNFLENVSLFEETLPTIGLYVLLHSTQFILQFELLRATAIC